MSDRVLEEALFGKRPISRKCKIPDFEYIHKELARNGVTLSLLWNEYCENCRMEGSRPLMYTRFCYHYQEFAAKYKATLRIEHKPGERLEVDWAGDTASLVDNVSGEEIPVYIFIAVLSCSGYSCWCEKAKSESQRGTGRRHTFNLDDCRITEQAVFFTLGIKRSDVA
jgi:transposase